MIVLFFMLLSIIFLIYGALVTTGKFVPPTSKLLIEDEERAAWCKTEGLTKIFWGLDMAFLSIYLYGAFLPVLWLGLFLVFTVYIIITTYKNNQKYMK